MTAPILRPYQVEFIEEFNRLVSIGVRRILGVAPTAAGKTVIFADIIRAAVAAQKSVLVISHRREIISQTSQKPRAASYWPACSRARSNLCKSQRSKRCTLALFAQTGWRCRRLIC